MPDFDSFDPSAIAHKRPAFTFLMVNVEITILDNTVTVYPAPAAADKLANQLRVAHRQFFPKESTFINEHSHYRLKFNDLTISKLLLFFSRLEKDKVISLQEKNQLIGNYFKSHALTSTISELFTEIEYFIDSDQEFEFLFQLDDLCNYADNLEKTSAKYPAYQAAAKTANVLADEFYALTVNFFSHDKDKTQFIEFKNNMFKQIKLATPVLETHRGWKQMLGNIALAIFGLGIFYGIAIAVNKYRTGNFLFFKTNSKQYLEKLEKNIENLHFKDHASGVVYLGNKLGKTPVQKKPTKNTTLKK